MPLQFVVQGRVVWGHPGKLSVKKNRQTRQPVIGKDGQPVQQCAFGLAIEKQKFYNEPLPVLNMSIYQALQAEARTVFPNGTPQNFSWKFKDGDGVDNMGKPLSAKEGYAGHCVLTIATQGFAPQIYVSDGKGGWLQKNPDEVKCGDFVAVNITIKYNGSTGTNTPGLYVNPNGVIFLGYGAEIVGGADPDEMFSGIQPQQFAGMSATPQLPAQSAMPGSMHPGAGAPAGYPPQPGMAPAPYVPGAPGGPAHVPYTPQQGGPVHAPYTPPAPPAPPAGYPPQPGAPLPPPAHDFVHNAVGQPPAAPAYAPPAAPGYPPQPAYAPPVAAGYPQPGMPPGIPQGR